jgi:hypothetical protein
MGGVGPVILASQARMLPIILTLFIAVAMALPVLSAQLNANTSCHDSDWDDLNNWVDAAASIRGPSPEYSHGEATASGGAGLYGCIDPFQLDLELCTCSQWGDFYYEDIPLVAGMSATMIKYFGVGETGSWVGASASTCEISAQATAWLNGMCSYCRG